MGESCATASERSFLGGIADASHGSAGRCDAFRVVCNALPGNIGVFYSSFLKMSTISTNPHRPPPTARRSPWAALL
jgi:hypothetical protein